MKLTAYVDEGANLEIRPAPVLRDWMTSTQDRFAYRCLPLNIANSHGWEILCPATFSACWSGNNSLGALSVNTKAKVSPAESHFGFGVLTFPMPCLFETDPGVDLFVQGPINRPKDGISPLSAIVETDWVPFTFTMNWKFTRPCTVYFEEGEPMCHIFPLVRGGLEQVAPEIRDLSTNPSLMERNRIWKESRSTFLEQLHNDSEPARSERWQKHYFAGREPGGDQPEITEHRTKLRLKPFARRSDTNQEG